jgi:hypothetical protein
VLKESVTGMEENRKTGHSITEFTGDFGLGSTNAISAMTSPEFVYSITGTFDNTTKVLTFDVQRSAF